MPFFQLVTGALKSEKISLPLSWQDNAAILCHNVSIASVDGADDSYDPFLKQKTDMAYCLVQIKVN